jgi:hypothetical protein
MPIFEPLQNTMGYIQNRLIAGRRAQHLAALSTLFSAGDIQPCITDSQPSVSYGQAFQAKKEEDFIIIKTNCQRISGDGSTTFDAFAVHIYYSLIHT